MRGGDQIKAINYFENTVQKSAYKKETNKILESNKACSNRLQKSWRLKNNYLIFAKNKKKKTT